MSHDSTSPPILGQDPDRASHRLDRASVWLVALVLVASMAMGIQTAWWSWHPPHQIDELATWNLLYVIVAGAGRNPWVRWFLVAGTAAVALAAVGVVLRRAWGLLLALPCSASLIVLAGLGRNAAIFAEPRQYVSRSPYVHAALVVALVTVASHGAAGILGVRLLCRRPMRLALARLILGTLAVLVAALPVLWIYERMPGGVRNAVMMCACAVAALAALVACALPRRGAVLAALGVSLTTLAVFAVGIVLHLHDRPRRGHLYSAAAELAIAEVTLAAPYVLAMIGVCIAMRFHLAAAHGRQARVQDSAA